MTGWRKAARIIGILMLPVCFGPRSGASPTHGKHFILLIDDSGDAEGQRPTVIEQLPRWVFRGPRPDDPSSPRFDPNNDTLSMLFFALSDPGKSNECKEIRGYTISPDTVFHFEPIAGRHMHDERAFQEALREVMYRECRFSGQLSPITTSQVLALPFVQTHLPDLPLFSEVLIATVSNDRYNFPNASPAAELYRLDRDNPQFHVQVPESTLALIQNVTRTFALDTERQWSTESQDRDLHYRVVRAVPRGQSPNAALVFNHRIQIERVASGSDRLFGMPRIPQNGDIRIPRGQLVPLSMTWNLEGEQRQPWRASVAQHETAGTVDLAACGRPVCFADADGIRIHPFTPAANPIVQSPAQAPFGPGALAFRVAFRLDTSGQVYDHLYLESDVQRVELTPVPLASVAVLGYPVRVDNGRLMSLWSSSDGQPPDGGLGQDDAIARLRMINAVAWLLVALVLLVLAILLARRSKVYSFEPALVWQPASDLVIDFNQSGHSFVLVGSITVRNGGTVGGLGRVLARWVGKAEQPTRTGHVELGDDPVQVMSAVGIQVRGNAPLGFLNEQRELVSRKAEVVSDGCQIHLFMAEEAVADFALSSKATAAETVVTLEHPVRMHFQRADVASPRFAAVTSGISFQVRIKPERPRAPKVSYVAASGSLHFKKDGRLLLGHFSFRSSADHHFALPFHESYETATVREGRPLAKSPVAMLPSTVTVTPRGRTDVRVELLCVDDDVRNPDPVSDHYVFVLKGPHERDYQPAKLSFDLYRDPAKSEIELLLTYRSMPVEVYWDSQRQAWECREGAGSAPRQPIVSMADDVVQFKAPFPFGIGPEALASTPIALTIQVGNSARSGKGSVEVSVTAAVTVAPARAGAVHAPLGGKVNDLLDLRLPRGGFMVQEGDRPLRGDIYLRAGAIESIDSGEIKGDDCSIDVTLRVTIRSDGGGQEKRLLKVAIPLHLEQLPGPNWLVIDFGTSSVAAAIGTAGAKNDSPLLDLQHLRVYKDESIAKVDDEGSEQGTRFLPSWIVCDADDRQTPTDYGRKVPPGFPGHTGEHGASLLPSSSSFITLPARTSDLEKKSERVILSLKTWLGINAESVSLPVEVSTLDDGGKAVKSRKLPLDDLVEASYSALYDAYLKNAGDLPARQVVVCHPNTFSRLHRERLHGIVRRALLVPLKIAHPKHIQLLSESDAVAYAYCWDRMDGSQPPASERVLVYDLGAGTLDLSMIRIEWSRNPIYPVFRERFHMGVPVAGNYFDETLARIIHDLLLRPEVLGSTELRYTRPVVAQTADMQHQQAARALWKEIRQAKHRWGKGARFAVVVGNTLSATGVVDFAPAGDEPLSKVAPTDDARVIERDQKLVLSIPERLIVTNPRMVKLVEFLSSEVLRETLAGARVKATDVNTLIVSGRGALWPRLIERVQKELPHAHLARFMSSDTMKDAVVRGAIARQDFLEDSPEEETAATQGRLAVVYGPHDETIVFEDQWDAAVSIPYRSFRLVHVGIANPDPRKDLAEGSLRHLFYVGVGQHEYLTSQYGHLLTFWKEENGDVLITNEENGVQNRVGPSNTVQHTRAPWPVGHAVLSPEK